jgi:hypothetical protein
VDECICDCSACDWHYGCDVNEAMKPEHHVCILNTSVASEKGLRKWASLTNAHFSSLLHLSLAGAYFHIL